MVSQNIFITLVCFILLISGCISVSLPSIIVSTRVTQTITSLFTINTTTVTTTTTSTTRATTTKIAINCQCPYQAVQGLDKCYQYIPGDSGYGAAEAYCEKHGGHLIKVDTTEELNWLLGLRDPGAFVMIGARRITTGIFWTDGTKFTNLPGCSDSVNGTGNYMIVSNPNYPCGYLAPNSYHFVCEKEPQ